jgi:hypothetical protein
MVWRNYTGSLQMNTFTRVLGTTMLLSLLGISATTALAADQPAIQAAINDAARPAVDRLKDANRHQMPFLISSR